MTESDVDAFKKGVDIGEDKLTLPATLKISDDPCKANIIICEGKFHQIKRMFAAVGREVVYLKRLSMGPLVLDGSLPPGAYRRLTEEEESAIIGL
jgi:16S rRNA pseudouridine516 synthase